MRVGSCAGNLYILSNFKQDGASTFGIAVLALECDDAGNVLRTIWENKLLWEI